MILFSSCRNKKELIYFQGSLSNNETNKNYSPILKSDDLLSIIVFGLDEQSVKPFNLPLTTLNQNIGGYAQGAPTAPGYLIDETGNIDFPIVGKIKVGGLSRSMAIELIKSQLKPYLNNPTVLIKILNYKVTVLGEVKNPGTFTIPNERITIPEALGIAGDLQITGIRKNVMVIRDNEGVKTEFIVDLTNKNIFSSPVYYLQQNDIVYVEPNRAKINSSVINPANVSLIISIISLFVTIAVLFTK
ncbi:MAG: polysaccharide biosynthesis/export family protein [Sphingobacteriaceae bacterium]|nr:polysaccharide biosynthesis/export family protein [Sphingobacteriaceae bacterium]